ncbi:MAG: tyrosine-protein phosphatase [Nocardioidaceae bacterium]
MTASTDHADRWISLDGAVNVRDLGGLPLRGGGVTRFRRLLRSDNLQDLTGRDVRLLRDTLGLTDVVDLRTGAERSNEGAAPLDGEASVTVHHLSLLPRAGDEVKEVDGSVVMPWQGRDVDVPVKRRDAQTVYLAYLQDRPDSVVSALAAVARADGAVLVHCAAGKDRTGVISALALDLAGVERDATLTDFLLSGDRIDAILGRLLSSDTYADDLRGRARDTHLPRAAAIEAVFALVDEAGGAERWLQQHGWTPALTDALRSRLRAV